MKYYPDIQQRIADYALSHTQQMPADDSGKDPEPVSGSIKKVLHSEMTALISFYNRDGSEYFHADENFRLSFHKIPSQGILHRHDFIEILYVAEGEFDQILMGQHLHFTKDSFVIADRNCEHSEYYLPQNSVVLFLQVSSSLMDELLSLTDTNSPLGQFLFRAIGSQKKDQSFIELRRISPEHNFTADRLLEQLYYESFQHDEGSGMIRRGLLLRLLHTLSREYSPLLHSDTGHSGEQVLLWELERYIKQNCADVTAAKLEAKFHYHRNYYNLLLKKYCGRTFVEYVRDVRLSLARQLLRDTNLSIKEVAGKVGYENTGHFYRIFEEKYHRSPNDMRIKP